MATAVQNFTGSDEQEGRDTQEHDEPKYKIGVLAGLEFSTVPNAELTKEQENLLKDRCKVAAKRDYPARLIEVIQAWEKLDVETPIATPNGWMRIGDLQAGDYVFGSNGRIVDVPSKPSSHRSMISETASPPCRFPITLVREATSRLRSFFTTRF